MLKLPYGIANFRMLREMGYFYQDRSNFIEVLENMPTLYHLLLRPRKFGKSLFLSMLGYYYDINEKQRFESLFGGLYIGENPTPGVNNYLVLHFDFSGIDTSSDERTYEGFLTNVNISAGSFIADYPDYYTAEEKKDILSKKSPEATIKSLLAILENKNCPYRVCILIDEYDQFANELLSFDTDRFKENVSRNGFVRKFYENIKEAAGRGIVGRMFITGVASVTVDSLTSGFNIITHLTLNSDWHNALGFTHEEVRQILISCDIPTEKIPDLQADLTRWYNGYLFTEGVSHRIFNPNMLLYFLLHYTVHGNYPRQMLDVNILSDYRKIRNIFNIGGREKERMGLLEDIVKNGYIDFNLTINFNLEGDFSDDNFLSLLFYMGILTIKEPGTSNLTFEIPNYVIKQLYFEYFTSIYLQKTAYKSSYRPIDHAIDKMVNEGSPADFFKIVETVLQQNHSNRDELSYGEKHLQTLMIGLLFPYKAFMIHSEYEAGRQYPDIFLEKVPDRIIEYEIVMEIKYLKKKEIEQAATVIESAKNQLQSYLQQERFSRPGVLGFWVVFVGGEVLEWGAG